MSLSPPLSHVERPFLDVLRQLTLPVGEHRHRTNHQSSLTGVHADGRQAGLVPGQPLDKYALVPLGVQPLGS